MSDDDLWRTPEPADRPQPVTDETQPLSGLGTPPADAAPAPPPAPPGPPPAGPPPTTPYGAVPGPGAVPPPANPYATAPPPQSPYQPPPNPYPQPGSFDQYAAPGPYGAQTYGAYPGAYGAGLPEQPSATTAMVLGIIGLVGIAFCGGITLVLSPFAWVIGSRSVREIDANPGRYAGRDKANAGKIMGIIGTILLGLGILAVLALVGLLATTSSGSSVTHTPVEHHVTANS